MRRTRGSWLSKFAKLGLKRNRMRRSSRRQRRSYSTYTQQLGFEALEDRQLLAITVNTLADEADGSIIDGDVSLRDAIAVAAEGETINFHSSLTKDGPARILLNMRAQYESALVINKNLTIEGPGAGLLTIDASGNDPSPDSLPFQSLITTSAAAGTRVFRMMGSTKNITLRNLAITGGELFGNSGGGAIRSQSKLTLDNVHIFDNMACMAGSSQDVQALGGGIYQEGGSLTIINSTISQNTALHYANGDSSSNITYQNSGRGGGIYVTGNASVSIVNSTISHNQARYEGGGLFITGMSSNYATLTNVTVYGNRLTENPNYSEHMPASGALPANYWNYVHGGGGIAVHGSASGKVTLHNTLVAGNVKTIDTSLDWPNGTGGYQTKIARTADDIYGTFNGNSSYNLIGYDEVIGNGIEKYDLTDASMLNDTDNHNLVGGETPDALGIRTGINAKVGKHTHGSAVPTLPLLPGSPAIDAGSDTWADNPDGNVYTSDGLKIDQRGFSRFMGPDGIGTVDIGAHETGTIVTSLGDDGSEGTLRDSLLDWNATTLDPHPDPTKVIFGEIVFSPSLFGANSDSFADSYELALTDGELPITKNLWINGPGEDWLTIRADEGSRVFNVGSGATATIHAMTLRGGNASASGGAILNGGNLTIDDVTLVGNVTEGDGGAVHSTDTLRLLDSTFEDNTGDAAGAVSVVSNSADALIIERSLFVGNHALVDGGALVVNGSNGSGNAKIVNSTFSGNDAAQNAGAIQVNAGSPAVVIVNSTITKNVANGAGGGIQTAAEYVTLQNSIVAVNTAANAADDDISGDLELASNFNLFGTAETGQPGANNVNTNSPGLKPLGDYGGPTQSHALAKGSPAIDSGNDSYAASLVTDQRGFSRKVETILSGTTAGGRGTVDRGAHEAGLLVTTWSDKAVFVDTAVDSDSLPDAATIEDGLSLREALWLAENRLRDAPDYITFDPDGFDAGVPRTITLGEDENGGHLWNNATELAALRNLTLESDVYVVGPGATKLTIDAASQEKIDTYVDDPNTTLQNEDDNYHGIRVFEIGDPDDANALDPFIQTDDRDPTNPHLEWNFSTISGLTITGGKLEKDGIGGGVFNWGTLTLDNVIVRENSASLWGGGVFSVGDLIIENSIVDSNRATGQNGAYSGGVSSRGIVEVVQTSTADGEQLNLIRPGSLTIVNSQFTRNASTHAGAFDAEDGAQYVRVHNSTFAENYSVKTWFEANPGVYEPRSGVGGLQIRGFDYGDSAYHTNPSIADSRDLILGGLDPNEHGRVQALITNTTISNNYSVGEVGGLNVTGLVDATILSSTIAFNRSPGWGNGIFARFRQGSNFLYGDTKVELHNTIVAHNIADDTFEGVSPDYPTFVLERNLRGKFATTSSHNLISYESDPTNGINDDNGSGNQNIVGESAELLAGLAPLGDYGGIVLPDGTHLLTHALTLGSRAIDKGGNSHVDGTDGAVIGEDARGAGFDRVKGNGNQVDIGAFEVQSTADTVVLVTTKDDETIANGNDSLSLREAVALVRDQPTTNNGVIHFSPYFVSAYGITGSETWYNLRALATVTSVAPYPIATDPAVPDTNNPAGKNADGRFETATVFEYLPGAVPAFVLTNGSIVLDTDVEVVGWGADILTVDGNDQSRVFQVDSGVEAVLKSLKITGGDAGSSNGGGINNQGDLVLSDVHIIENDAYRGGGLYSDGGGTATIVRSVIEDNSATLAGGIDQVTGQLHIKASTIRGNVASYSTGGVFVREQAYASVVGSLFVDNRAPFTGGLYVLNSDADVINSTFSANITYNGGGGGITTSLASYAGLVNLINLTVFGNQGGATWGAGGISAFQGTVLHNSIVAKNTSGGGVTARDVQGNFATTSSHNLIGILGETTSSGAPLSTGLQNDAQTVALSGTPSNAVDPMLTALGDHGGPTMTHALLSSSTAIDAGDNEVVDEYFSQLELDLLDQRGFDRVVDWDGTGGDLVDIGAVELAYQETHS